LATEYLILVVVDDAGSVVMVSGGAAVFVVLGGDAGEVSSPSCTCQPCPIR
jgi:hypothetical protein